VTDTLQQTHLEVDPASSKLAGRTTELERLRGSLQRAFHGERQLVFVTWESGIGKTALADEFQRQVSV
jgi:predicted ATPase